MWLCASMMPGMTVRPLRSTRQSPCAEVVADRGKAAVPDQHLRDDSVGRVHRVDPPVDEEQVLDGRLLRAGPLL